MIDSLKSKLLNSPEWVISICVFLVYWLVNKSYTGPANYGDDIGYLANAALISGYVIDGANSWHAGYSFFLAPLFLMFSEPSHIWQAAMLLNALIWSISFILLARILKLLLPELSKQQLLIALFISAAYPAWITMSGYVFATTAFVFVYLLSILMLLFWKPDKFWTIIPHCLFVGYLFWVHPVGLAICISSFIVVGFVSIREKSYTSVLLHAIIIVIMITAYRELIDKWLILLATPEGYNPLSQHYPDSERLFGRLFNHGFWLQSAAKFAGQISYLIVSSFGLIFFGLIVSINKSYQLIRESNRYTCKNSFVKQSVYVFLILSLLGVLAMGVALFSGTTSRIDQWIYGRYTEMVILPLLAVGYLSFWRKKWLYGAAVFVFITGLILSQSADMSTRNNLINTIAFWPQYLIWHNNFFYWMTAGTLALVLLGRLWNDSKLGNTLIAIFVMVCFVISSVNSSAFHNQMFLFNGNPSTYVDIIRKNYPPGTCVGFNPIGTDSLHAYQTSRYFLNLFYLYDYNYRRMLPEEWLQNCNGPYFTYQLGDLYEQQGVILIGQDILSNIYLLGKDDGSTIVIPDVIELERDMYHAHDWSIDHKIHIHDKQLAEMAGPVGYYEDGSIYSTGAKGFLFSDSSKKLGPGKYKFILRGEASASKGSWVEIISNKHDKGKTKLAIINNPGIEDALIASGKFFLEDPAIFLEVQVYVESKDFIRVDGYEIEYVNEVAE